MDYWDGVSDGRQVCWNGTLRCYTGVLKGIHGWYQDMVHRDGTRVHQDSTQGWWDGTLQDSVNKEAKWTLERAPLSPLLKLTPPFVTVADDIGFLFP